MATAMNPDRGSTRACQSRNTFALCLVSKLLNMSYQKKIDEMVGQHVAEFQLELTLARRMAGSGAIPSMPYGYPLAVYRPMHVCRRTQIRRFVATRGGKSSNGVPKSLRTLFVGQYLLGIYNPMRT